MNENNRQYVLVKRPKTDVTDDIFEYREGAIPDPGDGEVLLKTLYLSFDPTQRGWLNDVPSYIPPVQIGEPMRAGGIGQVVQSNNPDFAVGDIVQGTIAWQDYTVVKPGGAMPLTKLSRDYPLTHNMSIFGVTGLTGYFGLLEIGQPKEGDTVVVSGAAGATGSVAGQIAKIKGCRVIGIAGGPEKCNWLTSKANFDAAIDYKNDDVDAKLKELCPNGINVYFDNVGGEILDAALLNLAGGARIVVCGGISSGYHSWGTDHPPKNYMNLILHSARMEGFLVLTYAAKFPEAIGDLAKWVQEGKIHFEEDIVEGLENAPATLRGLFEGKNLGKLILHVADPE